MDQDTKSLVRGLLQRNPALRLCEPRIKRHPYFSMIDWQHVYHKRYIPPYIPPIDPANASDTQNFDDAFLEMEPILDTDMENDDQTGSERDRSTTDLDTTNIDEERQPSANGSPAIEPQQEPDIFDGYSFKARNSVIIEDDDGNEGSDETDGEASIKRESIIEQPEDELEAGQKTPDAHINVVPPTPTPASAVVEAFRKQQEVERAAAASPTAEEGVDKHPEGQEATYDETPAPKTPTNKVEELGTSGSPAPASPEKELPKPPAPKEEAPKAPSAPVEKEKKVVTISEKPRAKPVEHVKPKTTRNVKPARRERSGVAALDRDLSDVIDEDEMPAHDEDDDWDFVEALGAEDYNGQQGKSLFARGVVDRYRLRVFGKPSDSKPRTLQRNPSSGGGASSTTQGEFSDMPVAASPTPSDKKRGRGGLSLRKPKTFLRAKSPAATYSAGSSSLSRPMVSTQPATFSGSSSGVLMTPSASTPLSTLPPNGTMSLKSHPSMNSMGSPGSSDTSVNGNDLGRGSINMSAAEFASPGKSRGNNKSSPDLRRQARASTTDGDESRQKGLKKMRKYTEQGAEKVMSLFSSPRPSPSPSSGI
jgi:serum/glucocorticoid-regulated kinase 2